MQTLTKRWPALTALLALLMTAAVGCATTPGADPGVYDSYGFGDWDTNDDNMLDNDEFGEVFDDDAGIFGDWDTNDDGALDGNELGAGFGDEGIAYDSGLFSTWDANGDNMLDDDELGDGLFTSWDTDNDNFLNDDEFLL